MIDKVLIKYDVYCKRFKVKKKRLFRGEFFIYEFQQINLNFIYFINCMIQVGWGFKFDFFFVLLLVKFLVYYIDYIDYYYFFFF